MNVKLPPGAVPMGGGAPVPFKKSAPAAAAPAVDPAHVDAQAPTIAKSTGAASKPLANTTEQNSPANSQKMGSDFPETHTGKKEIVKAGIDKAHNLMLEDEPSTMNMKNCLHELNTLRQTNQQYEKNAFGKSKETSAEKAERNEIESMLVTPINSLKTAICNNFDKESKEIKLKGEFVSKLNEVKAFQEQNPEMKAKLKPTIETLTSAIENATQAEEREEALKPKRGMPPPPPTPTTQAAAPAKPARPPKLLEASLGSEPLKMNDQDKEALTNNRVLAEKRDELKKLNTEEGRDEFLANTGKGTFSKKLGLGMSKALKELDEKKDALGKEIESLESNINKAQVDHAKMKLANQILQDAKEKGDYKEEGWTRLSPSASEYAQKRSELEKGSISNLKDVGDQNVRGLALKQTLLDTYHTRGQTGMNLRVIKNDPTLDDDQKIEAYNNEINQLPEPNKSLVNNLLDELAIASTHKDKSKMGASNYAITITPNLFPIDTSSLEGIQQQQDMTSIVTALIQSRITEPTL